MVFRSPDANMERACSRNKREGVHLPERAAGGTLDRYGNEEADKSAKHGVEEHRVPLHIRLELKQLHSMVWRTAKWLGAVT